MLLFVVLFEEASKEASGNPSQGRRVNGQGKPPR